VRSFDLQSLSAADCRCRGYVKRTGNLPETGFTELEPMPSLRIASGDR